MPHRPIGSRWRAEFQTQSIVRGATYVVVGHVGAASNVVRPERGGREFDTTFSMSDPRIWVQLPDVPAAAPAVDVNVAIVDEDPAAPPVVAQEPPLKYVRIHRRIAGVPVPGRWGTASDIFDTYESALASAQRANPDYEFHIIPVRSVTHVAATTQAVTDYREDQRGG